MILLGYGRKSKADGPDVPGLERQQANCARYAAQQGLDFEWHQDHDLSGFYEDTRPGWQRVRERLRDPDTGGVVCEALDRIYRNASDFSQFKSATESAGKKLYILNMLGVDGTTAMGDFILKMQAQLGELEYRLASERQRRQLRHIRYEQRRHTGNVPFGCDRDSRSKHLVPSTRFYYYAPGSGLALPAAEQHWLDAAPQPPPGYETRYYHDALTAVYALYGGGQHSYAQTAVEVNRAGWRFWARDRWTPQEFSRLTIDSITERHYLYAGELEPGLTGGHAPLLPVELCRQVEQVRRQRHQVRGPGHSNQSDYIFILSGVLRCGRCGARMGGQKHGRRPQPYHYRHMYQKAGCPEPDADAPALEAEVLAELRQLIEPSPALRQAVAGELRAILREISDQQPSNLADLQRAEGEAERLIDLHVRGLITQAQFISRKTDIDQRIMAAKKAASVPAMGTLAEIELEVERLLAGLLTLRQPASRLDAKNVIRDLFERIEVLDGRLHRIVPAPGPAALFGLYGMSPELMTRLQSTHLELV